MKDQTDKLAKELFLQVTRLEEEIELLRSRSHKLFSYLTAIRLKAELAGWKFQNHEWEMPTINPGG